ncbi:MAG: sugar ABC transporter permease [Cereibacter sphaeroides]|uniref:Transport permease protein n=1 Tax=Cereibacter sphaeroides TaxID=1063 RepID=A0A2W5SCZ2_CERSP|nr:MAG: sugar ABC transporter permease [Cereibacter sphaeroides]
MIPPAGLPRHTRRGASLRAMGALMLREMATTYGRSPGGYLWAVLEPVAGIALLSLVFSLGFQSPPLGRNFTLFHATGLMPFLIYTTVSGRVALALLFSRSLLAYPVVTFADAILARFALNIATQLLVAYIVFGGLLLAFETQTVLDPGPIALSFVLTAVLALGVGTLNCYLFSRHPTWQLVWSILMRPLFLVSGVFFTLESVPQPWRDWLWWNPLLHAVGLLRRGFYPGYRGDYVDPLYVIGVSLAAFCLGFVLLRRSARDLVND